MLRLIISTSVRLAGLAISASPGLAEVGVAGDIATNGFAADVEQSVSHEIDAGHIPGAVIRIDQADTTLYERALGKRILGPQPQAIATDTIFDLASLTKVVATTTAIMQLVDAHRINLDHRVAEYWPAFAAHGKGKITLRQLLTHTSGLRPDLSSRRAWQGQSTARRLLIAERPVSRPGTRFEYSDINFIVLGELVQRISGEPLDVYAQRHIFQPLGLHDTRFHLAPEQLLRVAPTDIQDGSLREGVVQDPTAARMSGVAGHAGLFSTVDDLARFAHMLINGGELEGVRILSPEAVAAMTHPSALPGGVRHGLGWDMRSPYSMNLDVEFGPAAYGHTGYTGTMLWIDPLTQTSLIVLSSRLYPDDRGDAKPLRVAIAHEVAANYIHPPVLPGIDVLARQEFAPLAGLRVGLLTNQTGRDIDGHRSIDLLAQAPNVKLVSIFTPEHGLGADREGVIDSSQDAVTGLPIISLYGRSQRPQPGMLDGLDAIVIDLQDAGVRFYTYPTTVAYILESAAMNGLQVFVLDRPNPIDADVVQGPLLDPALRSFTGYFPMPLRPGMTLGEMATMFNGEGRIGARLTVIPMQGYRRSEWYDDTHLPWINPSPNLRSLNEATLYPGVGLIEAANVSVGRGTSQPFEQFGAPWIDSDRLVRYLTLRNIDGVRFSATHFTPDADRYKGRLCQGVHVEITDRYSLDSARLGIELAAALHRLYPEQFELEATTSMMGSAKLIAAIASGQDPRGIAKQWQPQIDGFLAIRGKYVLYR
jgi:uncharacterized protein YbbC (DUF1343 family)/CubicO group peptidase (beta-lactamase class C family)